MNFGRFPIQNSFNFGTDLNVRKATIADVAAGAPSTLKYSSGSKLEDYTCVSSWTVRGVQTLREGRIESVPFTHQNDSKWCMVLEKSGNDVFLRLLLKQCAPKKILTAKLKVEEVLPSGERREMFPSEWAKFEEGEESRSWTLRRPFGDEITLQCEVTMQCVIQDEVSVADTAEPHADVVRAVNEMFHSQVLTDFELHGGGGTVLKAHRALLSVRSPYFALMLQPHTKEAQDGFVQVSDVKPEALKQVLQFLYTGTAPALKDMPWDLLVAAEKFQLRQLRRQCEAYIATCLTVDNAAETAVNASVLSCDLLWDRAVVFIRQNLNQVIRSQGWAEAIATRPEAVQRISELMG